MESLDNVTSDVILIFRGLETKRTDGRIGSRWNTDPYYAMEHANISPLTRAYLGQITLSGRRE